MGWIVCRIWTVGEDYPIAIYYKFTAGNFSRLGDAGWETEYLGVVSKNNVRDQIKSKISEAIESLAIEFFKSRGELK